MYKLKPLVWQTEEDGCFVAQINSLNLSYVISPNKNKTFALFVCDHHGNCDQGNNWEFESANTAKQYRLELAVNELIYELP